MFIVRRGVSPGRQKHHRSTENVVLVRKGVSLSRQKHHRFAENVIQVRRGVSLGRQQHHLSTENVFLVRGEVLSGRQKNYHPTETWSWLAHESHWAVKSTKAHCNWGECPHSDLLHGRTMLPSLPGWLILSTCRHCRAGDLSIYITLSPIVLSHTSQPILSFSKSKAPFVHPSYPFDTILVSCSTLFSLVETA